MLNVVHNGISEHSGNEESTRSFCANNGRFHVDLYSDLYYDSTELVDAAKKQFEEETKDDQPQSHQMPPHREAPRDLHLMNPHNNMGHHTPHESPQHFRQGTPMGYPYAGNAMGNNMSPMQNRPMPSQYGGGGGGGPYNAMPSQFYNDGSPMRMPPANMNMNMAGMVGMNSRPPMEYPPPPQQMSMNMQMGGIPPQPQMPMGMQMGGMMGGMSPMGQRYH